MDHRIVESSLHCEAVSHSLDLHVTGPAQDESGLTGVDDLRDGFAVGSVHDLIGSAANDKHVSTNFLPGFAQVQGLELLVESSRAVILAVGFVVQSDFHSGCWANT